MLFLKNDLLLFVSFENAFVKRKKPVFCSKNREIKLLLILKMVLLVLKMVLLVLVGIANAFAIISFENATKAFAKKRE